MKKILIVSYYGLQDSLKSAANSLEKLGYEMDTYPLFKYAHDTHDKIENYKDHFKSYIEESKPDILLYWYIGVPPNVIKYIRDSFPHIYSIFYNWDDPYSWVDEATQIREKCPNFDLVLSTCEETLQDYIDHGSKRAVFSAPGFDPNINYPLENLKEEDYICDVSICCTNLYKEKHIYKDQYINRKELIDKLISHNINLHVYGPESLKLTYPNNYKGFVKYSNLNDIYNKSKINLCTHVCSNKSKYINERSVLIIASGGLLLVDPIKDFDKLVSDKECVFFDNTDGDDGIISTIRKILSNYEDYKDIKNRAYIKSKEYTWDKWAEIIHKEYCLDNFDKDFYKQTYKLSEVSSAKESWMETYEQTLYVPYKFLVPKGIDLKKYSEDLSIEGTVEYLYWHYRIISKINNEKYIQPVKKSFVSLKHKKTNTFIDKASWFQLNSIFSEIYKGNNVDSNLLQIQEVVNNNPYCDVNLMLDDHFEIMQQI